MEPQERRRISPFRATKRSTKLRRLSKTTRLRVHVQTVGLNAETKKVSAPADGEECLLTFPFIGPFRATKRSTKLRRLSKTTRLRVHVQTVGLNAETKKMSAPADGEECLLTFPFIGPFRATKRSTKLRRLSKTTRLRVHVQTVGLNADPKKVSAPGDGEECLLTFPFIGPFRATKRSTKLRRLSKTTRLRVHVQT